MTGARNIKDAAATVTKVSDRRFSACPPRDVSLDGLKGALVVIMVLYHAMNIFSTASPTAYSYVRFISGSFILLSGYVVGRFQDTEFLRDALPVSIRLITRGLKLVILFIVLNAIILLTGFGNSTKELPRNYSLEGVLFDVFVLGVARAASFQILLPIGYVLISAPLFLWVGQRSKYAFVGGLVFAGIVDELASDSVNFYFYALGFIGVIGGISANRYQIYHVSKNTVQNVVAIISIEMLMKYATMHLVTYMICTILLVQTLYDACSSIRIDGRVARASILLGRYSLICYIGQIIFMQSLSKALSGRRWALGWETILVSCVTVLVLLGLCASLKFLQRRYKCVAKAYDLVFL